MAVFDDGQGGGPALFAGGTFSFTLNGRQFTNIAKWDGTSWTPVGSLPNVYALHVFDDGAGGGPALYAGEQFGVRKWNGRAWTDVGDASRTYALQTFDDGRGGGPALYAAGDIYQLPGFLASVIAKWNGVAWEPFGDLLGPGTPVGRALTVFDDGLGGGPALYAGGRFLNDQFGTLGNVAKWNGRQWALLGSGTAGEVPVMTVFNDGGGEALYVGGNFVHASGVQVNRIAKWNGTSWSSLAGGVNNRVTALTVFDDGRGGGPALYAAGDFTIAGGAPANRIARWNGRSWTALGLGLPASAFALKGFDDGSGADAALYAGGIFPSPGVGLIVERVDPCPPKPRCVPSDFNCDFAVDGIDLGILLAFWGPASPPFPQADLNGDGVINGIDLALLLAAWTG